MLDAPRQLNAHLWARHPDDYYIEPFWVSERLFAVERFDGDCLDPACGSGRIVASGRKAGLSIGGSDKVMRSPLCDVQAEFIQFGSDLAPVDCIISNPPFGIAAEFAEQALRLASRKVALLLPTLWLHGDTRSRWLQQTPLRRVLIITPRPSMPPGPVIEAGMSPGGGKNDFAWFIWEIGYAGSPEIGWLRRKP